MESRSFSILLKPVGADCNMACSYCYYLGRSASTSMHLGIMTDNILERATKQLIDIHGRNAIVEFAWHGGEPTLAGLDFYNKAIELQKQFNIESKAISNTMQTNGTTLNDEWCEFFAKNNFLIGVSIDGDEKCHDKYRTNINGNGSFKKVMDAMALLKKHGVPFNTLTAVNRYNSERPREVYLFLRELTDFMQFLPVVERMPSAYESDIGQRFAEPSGTRYNDSDYGIRNIGAVTKFSVIPETYGHFLCSILHEWTKCDIGRKYVQTFESTVGNIKKLPAGVCVHEAVCGHSISIERDGSVYSCDRFTYNGYKLGNINETGLAVLAEKNRAFGMNKTYGLAEKCFECEYITLCFGGCPKDRFADAKVNYLCNGYKIFFERFTKEINRLEI